MALQRLLIINPFISEQLAGGEQHAAVTDQKVPIMMSDLMTKVTKERAVRLTHGLSAVFAHDIISFCECDRDDAVLMSGHDLVGGRVGEKVENQPVLRVFSASSQRQAPTQERIKQSVFCELKMPPERNILRHRKVGHGAIVAAGNTIPSRLALGYKPIAPILGGVNAKWTVSSILCLYPLPTFVEGEQYLLLRRIAESVAASITGSVLEIEDVAAALAGKDLHCWPKTFLRLTMISMARCSTILWPAPFRIIQSVISFDITIYL